MSHNQPPNNNYLLPVALLALIVSVLFGASVFILTPKIQNSLAAEIQKELSQQSIPVDISLSGRDVTLHGTVSNEDEKKKAETISKKICGIRFVDNQLLTEKPENLVKLANSQSNNKQTTGSETIKETLATKADEKKLLSEKTEPEITTQPPPLANTDSIKTTDKTDKTDKNTDIAKETESSMSNDALVENSPENIITAKAEPTTKDVVSTSTEETATTSHDTNDTLTLAANNKQSADKEAEDGKEQVKITTKRKVLDYDSMLAAMNAYNSQKKKNRNNKRKQTPLALQFEKESTEILPQSKQKLNKLADRLQKNKKINIEIVVSAIDSSIAHARAKAINDYLDTKKVDSKRITTTEKSGADAVTIKENTQ